MARIPNEALVLVGDGRRALFLRNHGTPAELNLVVERTLEQENPPTREQGTDKPGRMPGSDGVSRGAVEQTDWHQQAETKFAKEIADELYRMGHSQEFQALLIVAPPKMLGDLRAKLHPEVVERLVGEVSKDLTGTPTQEIARLLS